MSILVKDYQLFVKTYPSGSYRLFGSSNKTSDNQDFAYDVQFTENVNGSKKLSFKIHSRYVDITDGEEKQNSFLGCLFSEAEVKLTYGGEDYFFIITDINESSSSLINTYQLEDAATIELSKNGFEVVLDSKLMNNTGTAAELAAEALKGSRWSVANDSEPLIEKVEEILVLIKTTTTITANKIIKSNGRAQVSGTQQFSAGTSLYAFYSSCTNKPHRFQFVDNTNSKNDDGIVVNDTQYFIECEPSSYTIEADGYSLPTGFSTTATIQTTHGERYGFAQKAAYVQLLDRYCQIYSKDGKEYYGYEETEYISPTFVNNLVSNTEFSNDTGWKGTFLANVDNSNKKHKAVIENVFGRFIEGNFVTSNDYLTKTNEYKDKEGCDTLEKFLGGCSAYLKVTFNGESSLLINDGLYDNRTLIGNMAPGNKYAYRLEILTDNGGEVSNPPSLTIDEYIYETSADGGYAKRYTDQEKKITFKDVVSATGLNEETYNIYEVNTGYIDEEAFKDNKLRLVLSASSGTYYIKNMEFFKASFSGTKVIPLEQQGTNAEAQIIEKTYKYFDPAQLDGANKVLDPKNLQYDSTSNVLSYNTYVPVYNEGGEKVRTISVKESNYFNILQTIAETFQGWLEIDYANQKVKFRANIGEENFASFRYGVNLQEVQRTFASKDIVTKLIVKQNSNQYGKNKFCAISRANSNPTGEDCIYDFEYYIGKGIVNGSNYVDYAYKMFFPELRRINTELQDKTEKLNQASLELTTLNSEKLVLDAKIEGASEGIEEARESFSYLTKGYDISDIVNNTLPVTSIVLGTKCADQKSAQENNGWYCDKETFIQNDNTITDIEIKVEIEKNNEKPTGEILATITPKDGGIKLARELNIFAYPKVQYKAGSTEQTVTVHFVFNLKSDTTATEKKESVLVDITHPDIQKHITKYLENKAIELEAKTELGNSSSGLTKDIADKQAVFDELQSDIDDLKEEKKTLNAEFAAKYGPYIKEGTWISEEYYDDEKYYIDAQSVMYNSRNPRVAYSINVLEISQLPGYEDFDFELGDRTYAEDPKFFGDDRRVKITITEKVDNLDDPTKNVIKVQSFKNQFQDLFQKIVATTQQVQYSTGTYEQGVATANAIAEDSIEFLTGTLGKMAVNLDNPRVSSKSTDNSCELRIVDGKLMIGMKEEGRDGIIWKTGIDANGIATSLLQAGEINTKNIKIMYSNDPVFKWDQYGISAYDTGIYEGVVGSVNTSKFVRFDKHGIYGINGAFDGEEWTPSNTQEIDQNATFALTWEGLKVTTNSGTTLRIGDGTKSGSNNTNILDVRDSLGNPVLFITEGGNLQWGSGVSPTQVVYSSQGNTKPTDGMSYSKFPETHTGEVDDGGWYKAIEDRTFASYTYDGGNTWGEPVKIIATDGEQGPQGPQGDSIVITKQTCFYAEKIIRYQSGDNQGRIDVNETYGTDGVSDGYKLSDKWYPIGAGEGDRTEPLEIRMFSNVDPNDSTKIQFGIWPRENGTDGEGNTLYDAKYWSGWYNIDNVSNFRIYKVVKTEYSDETITVELEQEVITASYSRDILLSMIADVNAADGIYEYTDQETQKKLIGINATAMRTGTLLVGNEDSPVLKAVFNPDNPAESTLNLAGWSVTNNSITKNTFGSINGFHMYSSSTAKSGQYFGANESKYWMLGIGSKFGVTTDGELYCTSGSFTGEIHARAGGSIAGWQVDTNSIITLNKGLGTDESFHMYSSGSGTITDSKFGQTNKNWALGIGSKFGVTTDGAIYATSGAFGNLKIGTFNFTDPIIAGATRKYELQMNSEWYSGSDNTTYKGTANFGASGVYLSALGRYDLGEGLYLAPLEAYSYVAGMGSSGTTTYKIGFYKEGIYAIQGFTNSNTKNSIYIFPTGLYFNQNTGGYGYDDGLAYTRYGTETSKSLCLIADGQKVKVADLVFKGPYNIIYSGRVVGKICQSGPVVYGYFQPGDKTNKLPTTKTTLYVQDTNGSNKTLPGPYTTVSTIWHGDNSGEDYGVSGVDFVKNGSGNLEITANAFIEDAWKGSTYRGNTYFCYSVNSSYHWGTI